MIVVSDLHFQPFKRASEQSPLLEPFFTYVCGRDELLILDGDTFDCFPYTFLMALEMFGHWFEDVALSGGLIVIEGNHDYGIKSIASSLELSVCSQGGLEIQDCKGRLWMIKHGHTLDSVWGKEGVFDSEQPKKVKFGRAFLAVSILLERAIPSSDDRLLAAGRKVYRALCPKGEEVQTEIYRQDALRHFSRGFHGYHYAHTHDLHHETVSVGDRRAVILNAKDWTSGSESVYFSRLEEDAIYEFTEDGPRLHWQAGQSETA